MESTGRIRVASTTRVFWEGAFVTLAIVALASLGLTMPRLGWTYPVAWLLAGLVGSHMGQSFWAPVAGAGLGVLTQVLGKLLRNLPLWLHGFPEPLNISGYFIEPLVYAPILVFGSALWLWLRTFSSKRRHRIQAVWLGAKILGGVLAVLLLYRGVALYALKTQAKFTMNDLAIPTASELMGRWKMRDADWLDIRYHGKALKQIVKGDPQFTDLVESILASKPYLVEGAPATRPEPDVQLVFFGDGVMLEIDYLQHIGVLRNNYYELGLIGLGEGRKHMAQLQAAGKTDVFIPLDQRGRSIMDAAVAVK